MKHRALLLSLVLASTMTVEARLAVFTDGRVLKVEDAYLEDQSIVLLLKGGGQVVVSALRIDRVVADEVEDQEPLPDLPEPSNQAACDPGFLEEQLPPATPFADLIITAARKADLHPRLLASLVRAESAFDQFAVSRVGAAGLTQLMPSAAADRGVVDVFNPADNLAGGATHLRAMVDRFSDLRLALAAYNAGASTVDRYGGVPPYRETRRYVEKVITEFCGDGRGQAVATREDR